MRKGKRQRDALKAYRANYTHNFVDPTFEKEEKETKKIVVYCTPTELFPEKATAIVMTVPVLERSRKAKAATHKNCKSEAKQNGIKDALTCANVANEKAMYSGGRSHYSHDLHSTKTNDFGMSLDNKWTARNKVTDSIRKSNCITINIH